MGSPRTSEHKGQKKKQPHKKRNDVQHVNKIAPLQEVISTNNYSTTSNFTSSHKELFCTPEPNLEKTSSASKDIKVSTMKLSNDSAYQFNKPTPKREDVNYRSSLMNTPTGLRMIKKPSTKLLNSMQSLPKVTQDRKKLSKNLITILGSLKKEYDNLDTTFTSPNLGIMTNPVMCYNNKVIGPALPKQKPDGVVNLDMLAKAGKYSAKRAKAELDNIIKKHTLSITAPLRNKNVYNAVLNGSKQCIPSKLESTRTRINEINVQKPASFVYSNNSPISGASFPGSTSSNISKIIVRSNLNISLREEIRGMRDRVDDAIRKHMIFTVYGHYYSIRNALVQRGWLEKIHGSYIPSKCDPALFKRLQYLTVPELMVGLRSKDMSHIYRQVIYSKLIGNQPVHFYWDLNRDTYRRNAENLKHATINFIGKTRFNYANKEGLCECSRFAHWYNNPGISYLRVPRSYSLNSPKGELEDFKYDFRISAAISLLKWTLHMHESKVTKLISECGKLPIWTFHFALEECAKFIQILRHEDIDKEIAMASEKNWAAFLELFFKAVHVGNHFQQTDRESELSIVHKSKATLTKLSSLYPYIDMDGYMNIWILKPSFGSRGVGIHFCRTLKYVLKVLGEHSHNTYVIQKYIERPLLIHNTKFDIRQWFLISSTAPLTIWIYKECYLRFSSQTYNLRKLHESIHLTNNSVQSKYHNGNRDPGLPYHNMWYLKDFKQYLDNIGHPNVFNNIIYPGMKECITAAILATQDQMTKSSKAFELHGADFMLTEDFKPWLIEINSKPALNPSTPVTSKLCPAVLEDVIKVVVDYSRNPEALTGAFQLAYKESVHCMGSTKNANFKILGKPITSDYFLTPEQVEIELDRDETHFTRSKLSNESFNVVKSADYMKYVSREMKNTLRQLLSLIEKEKKRRKMLREPQNMYEDKGGDNESFAYCQEILKIKSNVHEIEEIFKLDDNLMSNQSCDSIAVSKKNLNLVEASDQMLQKNSMVIENVISHIDSRKNDSNSHFTSLLKIISDLSFHDKLQMTQID